MAFTVCTAQKITQMQQEHERLKVFLDRINV